MRKRKKEREKHFYFTCEFNAEPNRGQQTNKLYAMQKKSQLAVLIHILLEISCSIVKKVGKSPLKAFIKEGHSSIDYVLAFYPAVLGSVLGNTAKFSGIS